MWIDSQKWGSFSLQKCNFKPKFANFMLKLRQIRQISQNALEAPEICDWYVKFDTKMEKRVIGCGPRKREGHWM